MTGDVSGGILPRQHSAVLCLLAGGSVADAAERVGVSERTMRRWVAGEAFQAALRAEARAQAREATSLLFAAQAEAVRALRDCLSAESPATRVRAARALLEVGLRYATDDLEERLTELERKAETWQTTDGSDWSVWSGSRLA